MSRYAEFAVFLAFVFDVTSGQWLTPFSGTITIAPNETAVCTSQLMCVEHKCNEGRWCVQSADGKWVQYGIITCDSNTPERYCNNGVCSRIPEPRCDPSIFSCPAVDGVYPDPEDCTRYHICIRGFRTTNVCPLNNVYDHATGSCKYRRLTSDCVRFVCGNQDGTPIVYPRDDRIYGRCFGGKAYISGRCQEYEKYNLISQRCERHCRSTGTQPPDPGSCGTFFLCAELSPHKYTPVEMSCGCDQAYDEKEKRCTSSAPCISETPEVRCKSQENNTTKKSGDGNDNEESQEQTTKSQEQTTKFQEQTIKSQEQTTKFQEQTSKSQEQTTKKAQKLSSIVDSPENPDVDKDRQSRNERRSIFSLMNKRGNRNNNNDDSNFDNTPSNLLIKDNADDNNNNVAANGDSDVDKSLAWWTSADNNGNNDNNKNPGIKQRENSLRGIIDWITRIITSISGRSANPWN
ncbi:PREDICTED: RGS domain-containing serine/threonine-protein kinase A [Dinoponera quadriceps]|uniref:RGS domain-containing serine/threonine-protein kinase A n=1 Tax=Dinoponera quadriceps TaxID=609295 RepID=A0A6P3XNE4_DINQU|nr:PREDICTED: RGS domain-containing serine/threonine-protein kinase A [Dinoponera quadriceps]